MTFDDFMRTEVDEKNTLEDVLDIYACEYGSMNFEEIRERLKKAWNTMTSTNEGDHS